MPRLPGTETGEHASVSESSMLSRLAAAAGGLVLLVVLMVGAAGAGVASLLGGGDSSPSTSAATEIPAAMLALYQQASSTCVGLPWTVLAAIGTVESDNGLSTLPGVHSGANSAGAEVICGPGFPCRHVRDASDPRRASRLSTSCEPRTASVLAS